MFVQGSSNRPLCLQELYDWPAAPLAPANPKYGDQHTQMYTNQYQHYPGGPLDAMAMSNQLQYPSSPSQASSDLCSVPDLDCEYHLSPICATIWYSSLPSNI